MRTFKRLLSDQKVRVILALAAGVALLGVWLSQIDPRNVLDRLAGIDARWIALFGLLWLAAAFLRSLRWRFILTRVCRIPPAESFGLFMSCMFINFLIPLRAGEAVVSLALKKSRGVPVSRSLPTQVMDRLFDLTPVVPALLVALFLGSGDGLGKVLAILAFVASVFAVLTAVVLLSMARPLMAARLIRGMARVVPAPLRPRVEGFAVTCIDGIAGLRMGVGTIAGLVGLTLMALALDAISLEVIFIGLGQFVSPAVILSGYTLLFLTSALPRPPGLVGSHEMLFLLIFSLFLGVDRNLASAAVVAGHVMLAVILTVTGTLSLFLLGIRSVNVVRENVPSVTTTGAS